MKNKLKKSGLRGYCTHNSIGPYSMPVPAQNIIFRDYCNINNIEFKMSSNELYFKNSYLQLNDLIKNSREYVGIMMVSIYVLPSDNKLRNQIFKLFLRQNVELHIILENIVAKSKNDFNKLNELLLFNEVSQNSLNEENLLGGLK